MKKRCLSFICLVCVFIFSGCSLFKTDKKILEEEIDKSKQLVADGTIASGDWKISEKSYFNGEHTGDFSLVKDGKNYHKWTLSSGDSIPDERYAIDTNGVYYIYNNYTAGCGENKCYFIMNEGEEFILDNIGKDDMLNMYKELWNNVEKQDYSVERDKKNGNVTVKVDNDGIETTYVLNDGYLIEVNIKVYSSEDGNLGYYEYSFEYTDQTIQVPNLEEYEEYTGNMRG